MSLQDLTCELNICVFVQRVARRGPLSKTPSSCVICTICIVVINSLYVLALVYDVDCVGFRGLNSRLRVVDGVDCVYGVSIRVNVNDGNDVGTDRARPDIADQISQREFISSSCLFG